MREEYEIIKEAIFEGDLETGQEHTNAALDGGAPAEEILQEALIPAMRDVGDCFERGECYLPDMLVAARAMKGCLRILRPSLVDAAVEPAGRVVIGTVQGDLHDIGKNLVSMMLEGAGFEVTDLGVNVPPERFVEAVRENKPDILAMSALLTTTMQRMPATLETLQESGIREQVKIMIGGAPITSAYAEEISADGYAADASQAVSLANRMVDSTY